MNPSMDTLATMPPGSAAVPFSDGFPIANSTRGSYGMPHSDWAFQNQCDLILPFNGRLMQFEKPPSFYQSPPPKHTSPPNPGTSHTEPVVHRSLPPTDSTKVAPAPSTNSSSGPADRVVPPEKKRSSFYKFVCETVCALQLEENQVLDPDQPHRSSAFDHVSKFCKVIEEQVLPHCSGSHSSQQDNADIALLILTAISIIITTYTSHAHLLSSGPGTSTPSSSSSGQLSPPKLHRLRSAPEECDVLHMGSPNGLHRLVQITVMDYHISQLQNIMNCMSSTDSLKSVESNAQRCDAALQGLKALTRNVGDSLRGGADLLGTFQGSSTRSVDSGGGKSV